LARLPDNVRGKLPPHIVARLEAIAPITIDMPSVEDVRATRPSLRVNWNQPCWVACYWVASRPDTPKESGHPGDERLRWTAPLPESHMLDLLGGVPSIEYANANKREVEGLIHHGTLAGWGAQREDVEFLGVYGPGTPEFAAAHKWASNARAMKASVFSPPFKHPEA
jgi:hypothetical protein